MRTIGSGVAAMFAEDGRFIRPRAGDPVVGRDAFAPPSRASARTSCHSSPISWLTLHLRRRRARAVRCCSTRRQRGNSRRVAGVIGGFRDKLVRTQDGWRFAERAASSISRSNPNDIFSYDACRQPAAFARARGIPAETRHGTQSMKPRSKRWCHPKSRCCSQQVEAGVTIVSDGELGKVGYSTYITSRLSGFGGLVDRVPRKISRIFRTCAQTRRHHGNARICAGIMYRQGPLIIDSKPMQDDIRRFDAAMRNGTRRARLSEFCNAGIVTAFQPNQFYSFARGLSRRSRRCDAAGI